MDSILNPKDMVLKTMIWTYREHLLSKKFKYLRPWKHEWNRVRRQFFLLSKIDRFQLGIFSHMDQGFKWTMSSCQDWRNVFHILVKCNDHKNNPIGSCKGKIERAQKWWFKRWKTPNTWPFFHMRKIPLKWATWSNGGFCKNDNKAWFKIKITCYKWFRQGNNLSEKR